MTSLQAALDKLFEPLKAYGTINMRMRIAVNSELRYFQDMCHIAVIVLKGKMYRV